MKIVQLLWYEQKDLALTVCCKLCYCHPSLHHEHCEYPCCDLKKCFQNSWHEWKVEKYHQGWHLWLFECNLWEIYLSIKKKTIRTRHKPAFKCIFVRELMVHKKCIVSLFVTILAVSGVTDIWKFWMPMGKTYCAKYYVLLLEIFTKMWGKLMKEVGVVFWMRCDSWKSMWFNIV